MYKVRHFPLIITFPFFCVFNRCAYFSFCLCNYNVLSPFCLPAEPTTAAAKTEFPELILLRGTNTVILHFENNLLGFGGRLKDYITILGKYRIARYKTELIRACCFMKPGSMYCSGNNVHDEQRREKYFQPRDSLAGSSGHG